MRLDNLLSGDVIFVGNFVILYIFVSSFNNDFFVSNNLAMRMNDFRNRGFEIVNFVLSGFFESKDLFFKDLSDSFHFVFSLGFGFFRSILNFVTSVLNVVFQIVSGFFSVSLNVVCLFFDGVS